VVTFTTLVSAFSTSSSNNWWKHTGPVFLSSSSLASSLCSSNGSQISHDSGLPQLLPLNNKLTCFSAYMPLMHLLMGRSYSDDWCSKGTGCVLFGSVSLHSTYSPIFIEVHWLPPFWCCGIQFLYPRISLGIRSMSAQSMVWLRARSAPQVLSTSSHLTPPLHRWKPHASPNVLHLSFSIPNAREGCGRNLHPTYHYN